jgi:serine/threonine protein kinase/CHASE2 domain-containing sensor protein
MSNHQNDETLVAKFAPTGSKRKLMISQATLKNLAAWLKKQRMSLIIGHSLMGTYALAAAIATAGNLNQVRILEQEAWTRFFQLRGRVAAPANLVILKMDEYSISQAKTNVPADPKKFAYLEPLLTVPWKRAAHAQAIDRLMAAGARAVAVDLVFDIPSTYGPDDDKRLIQTLQRYPGRITLAAQYPKDGTLPSGELTQLLQPHPMFQTNPSSVGSISYPIEADGRIHLLAGEYPRILTETLKKEGSSQIAKAFYEFANQVPTFAEATLTAAQYTNRKPTGTHIHFYGPADETFQSVSYWEVLDPDMWNQRKDFFRDKIVVIGPTGDLFQDFHTTPFGRMPGVEVNANAIATLLEGKALSEAISNLLLKGGFVFILVLGAGYLQSRTRKPFRQFASALGVASLWFILSYTIFTHARLIVPTSVPILAIALSGASYMFIGIASERVNLRRIVRQHIDFPVIREIFSEIDHSAIQPVIEEHDQKLIGKKLNNRYLIIRKLASGGFGETYIAEDTNRPGSPYCVVKLLKPANTNSLKIMRLAKSLFKREAETLEKLGKHDRIPRLLAYFEENNVFYLIQEYVPGKSLTDELSLGNLLGRLPERRVVGILQELLKILEFVHHQGVIHRDVKPGNIIRRSLDGKLVLIDFGAVKQIEGLGKTKATSEAGTQLTVAIGTDGFMAPEQADGRPSPSSDIYAAGIIGIQALTGISASELKAKRDSKTMQLFWKDNVQVSYILETVLDKMVSYNPSDRYHSAAEVLEALQPLSEYAQDPSIADDFSFRDFMDGSDLMNDPDLTASDETKPWPNTFSSADDLPVTALPLTDSPLEQEDSHANHNNADFQQNISTDQTAYQDKTEPPPNL